MKLNFWQWLGIIIVAIALVVIIRREFGAPDRAPSPAPNMSPEPAKEIPSTSPAAPPATQFAP
ncbi:MAG: hypothetical protein QOF78_3162 [Phycisphaerales bacterium]|jgi:hypothetical protein|nr:hypothetical protein [Phycisphaerales bacterium]MEA2736434.1 hypothetical protein [Humisphaera sp.]